MKPYSRAFACLAAAVAHAGVTAQVFAQTLRHLPQPGVRLEQSEQAGLELRRDAKPVTPAATALESKPKPSTHPKRASGRRHFVAEGPLRLKLSETLTWPPQNALVSASPGVAGSGTTGVQGQTPDAPEGQPQGDGQPEKRASTTPVPGEPLRDKPAGEEARRDLDLGLPQAAAARVPKLIPELSGFLAPSLRLASLERSKSGESGTSRLAIRRAPDLEFIWPRGAERLTFTLARVRLDAGPASPGTPVGSNLPGQPAQITAMDAGWEPRLGLRRQGRLGWEASLGTTPTDGPVPAAPVGELSVSTTGPAHNATARLYAEPVRDSILSYVGLPDPASGKPWGRVLRRGGAVQGYTALGQSGWNLGGAVAFEHLAGQNVADNDHQAVSASLTTDLRLPGMRFFALGPTASFERYRRNLSGFGWGHGGYFSPQRFVSAGALGVFQTEQPKRWVAEGKVQFGWQSVRQETSPCFALPPPMAGGGCAPLAESRSSGLGSATHIRWAYLLTPHLSVGAELALRTGPAYHDRVIHLGLRYHFDGRGALFADDLPERAKTLW